MTYAFFGPTIERACRELGTYTAASVLEHMQKARQGNRRTMLPTIREVGNYLRRNKVHQRVRALPGASTGGVIIEYRWRGKP